MNGGAFFAYDVFRGSNANQLLVDGGTYFTNTTFDDNSQYNNFIETTVTSKYAVFGNTFMIGATQSDVFNMDKILVNKGDSLSVKINNFMFYGTCEFTPNTHEAVYNHPIKIGNASYYTVTVLDINRNEIVYNSQNTDIFQVDVTTSGKLHNIEIKCDNIPTDILGFYIQFFYTYEKVCPWYTDTTSVDFGIYTTSRDTKVAIEIQSEEQGKLNNIIEAIKAIPEKITNGIKSLFVPSEAELTEYSNKWDNLLSQRFGALYQVGGMFKDFATNIKNSIIGVNPREYFEVAKIDIPLLKGDKLTIGGWRIPLKVAEFETIYKGINAVTGFLVTLLFLNGLRKRYDKLIGGD